MENKKLFAKLTAEDILAKEFTIEFKGYKVEEVDRYLDNIIEDFNFFESENQKKDYELKRLKEQLNDLKLEVDKLEEEKIKLRNQLKTHGASASAGEEIIKRLNNVEKHIKNKG